MSETLLHEVVQDGADAAPPLLRKKFAQTRKRFQAAVPPHVPALVVDAEGMIRHVTRAGRHLLEYAPTEEVERCFFSHVHGKNLYQVMRDVADMVCYGKKDAAWLLRLRTGQGRWRWYRAKVHSRLTEPDETILIQLRELQAV